jgi:hypothetical protein
MASCYEFESRRTDECNVTHPGNFLKNEALRKPPVKVTVFWEEIQNRDLVEYKVRFVTTTPRCTAV